MWQWQHEYWVHHVTIAKHTDKWSWWLNNGIPKEQGGTGGGGFPCKIGGQWHAPHVMRHTNACYNGRRNFPSPRVNDVDVQAQRVAGLGRWPTGDRRRLCPFAPPLQHVQLTADLGHLHNLPYISSCFVPLS
jgi:hypothetical protein